MILRSKIWIYHCIQGFPHTWIHSWMNIHNVYTFWNHSQYYTCMYIKNMNEYILIIMYVQFIHNTIYVYTSNKFWKISNTAHYHHVYTASPFWFLLGNSSSNRFIRQILMAPITPTLLVLYIPYSLLKYRSKNELIHIHMKHPTKVSS